MFQHYIYELKSTLKMCIVTFLFNFTYCLYNMKPLLFLTIKTMMSFKELNFIFTEVTNAFISYLHIVMVYSVILSLPFIIYNIFFFLLQAFFIMNLF